VGSHARFKVGKTFSVGDNWHGYLVRQALFGSVEAGLQVEDGLAVLNGDDTARREAFAVADAVDVVQDRGSRVAWTQEVGVKRMHTAVAVINRAGGGNESLTGYLATEDTLAIFLGRTTSEHVDLDGFKVKKGDQVVESFKHPYIMTRKSVFHTWFLASVSPVALLPLNPDELLSTTRAVRKRLDFDKPVPDELIRECVSLAMQSPSGSNSMTMQFIIVKDEAKRKAIGAVYRECFSQYQAMDGVYIRTIDKGDAVLNDQQQRSADSADYLGDHMGDAPVLVIPCNVGGRTEAAGGLGMMASSVMANILPAMWSFMLAARARGMGTAWTTVHLMMEQQVADILGIPFDTVQQVCLSPLAFTKGTDFKAAIRPDAETIIHWDKW